MRTLLHRPYASHVVVLLVYALLTLVMTLPLGLQLDRALLATDSTALNDSFFSVWIFGWQSRQLIADPLNLFQGNIFYPFPNTLAFSEIILPAALLYLPIEYASANPIFAYNLVLLVSFPLNAFAMYLYALDWFAGLADGKSQIANRQSPISNLSYARDLPSAIRAFPYAPFLGGLIFGFCTYKMGELRHVQLLMAMFMPLTLMYLARFMRVPTRRRAFMTALFFVLNALSSLYYAVFLGFAVLLYVGVDGVLRRFRLTRAHLVYGAAAGIVAALVLLPFILPFLQLEQQFNFSGGRDPHLFSARPAAYLATPTSQWLYGNLTRTLYVASKGQPLFPGIVVLALSALGLVALIRHTRSGTVGLRTWLFLPLLALMGFVLSFGPDLLAGRDPGPSLLGPLPYLAVTRLVPPLKSLNAPARFVVLIMLALSLFAAYGLYVWMARAPRWRHVIALGCAALIVLEYIPAPLRVLPVPVGDSVSGAYTFLAAQPRDEAVVELPMGQANFADSDRHASYTYNSLYHRHPVINGHSTFIPPDYFALVHDVAPFPEGESLERLQGWGARWLVVHSDEFKDAAQLRAGLVASERVEHVQDFGDIWLYRVRDP